MDRFGETFISEAGELLESVEAIVLDLEREPEDKDAVNRLFRAMHTIKGSGAMFGFDDIADFTHHVETALDGVRSDRIRVTDELIDLVLKSRDLIVEMLEAAVRGEDGPKSRAKELVAALVQLMPSTVRASMAPSAVSQGAPGSTFVKMPSASGTVGVYRIRFVPAADIFATGMDPAYLVEDLGELGQCRVIPDFSRIPSLDALETDQCFISWDVILETREPRDAISDVFVFVEDDSVVEIRDITPNSRGEPPRIGEILTDKGDADEQMIQEVLGKQRRIGELLVQEGKVSSGRVNAALEEQNVLKKRMLTENETVRVPSGKLDNLVNLVGELVISQSQISRIAEFIEEPTLKEAIEDLGRLATRMRDVALNVRMVPIGTTFSRFRRLVRDLSKDLGKEIKLETEGADTEIDKLVIDRLTDPLVHLIRNAVDHGLELPHERESKGKPRHGVIKLSAFHRGAKVVIRIEDDGRGLDTDRIRQKAISQGVISENAVLSESDIHRLILAPGFSTAEKVSSISGRGVGMDVVAKEIENLRGSIGISSTLGRGSAVQLELPLTLAIIDGLLVDVADNKYVIPIHTIRECMNMAVEHDSPKTRKGMISFRGELMPLVRLREVFHLDGAPSENEEAVVIDAGGKMIGIVVDHVEGKQQIVIKPIGRLFKHVKGVSGATIMGNGYVALILDVPSLVQIAAKHSANAQSGLRRQHQASSTAM